MEFPQRRRRRRLRLAVVGGRAIVKLNKVIDVFYLLLVERLIRYYYSSIKRRWVGALAGH